MNTVTIIGEFNDEMENVANYKEIMEEYFIANDITDDKKKTAVVITPIGSKTYTLIRDLLTPRKPNNTNFVDIWKILKTTKIPHRQRLFSFINIIYVPGKMVRQSLRKR